MVKKPQTKLQLSVTEITGHVPNPETAFPEVAHVAIGSLFHDICASLLNALETDPGLRQQQEGALSFLEDRQGTSANEKATQPLRDFLYDDLLNRPKFTKFHRLGAIPMLELWQAIDTFLVELATILHAAARKDLGAGDVLIGSEQKLKWVVNIDGTPLTITGKYDLLLHDPRFDAPHLIDFKLCGVKKDLAGLLQVMLYALMLNDAHGIQSDATILNIYPQRSPITVGWNQIKSFEPAMLAFIKYVAAEVFPGHFRPPAIVPNPRSPLEDGNTPFETPDLREQGLLALGMVEQKLGEFGLHVSGYELEGGPVVVGPAYTVLRVVPGPGVKVASVANRSADLQIALSCQAPPRIEQGPGYVRIEVPRLYPATIRLLDLPLNLATRTCGRFVLGVDIRGEVRWGDFSNAATCHMLVDGQTGSGKSEFLRQLLCSLALCSRPQELKMVIVDPKMTDYQDFNGSPYLRESVIDQMDHAVQVLEELVVEMDRRYALFRTAKVKDITAHNALHEGEKLPRLVVAFDEFADAMADKDLRKALEQSLKRLGAKARASGIHLIIATQTPRKEVVTGLIKANLPCAVALRVANGTESHIIIDSNGAEQLLGKGDLIAKIGGRPERLQSPFADAVAVKQIMFPGTRAD